MSYPIKDNNWNVLYDGKPTFFGVLDKYFDHLCVKYGLNPTTRMGYAKEYEHHILPRINERALESYTAEDLEEVITDIASTGKGCARSTLQHYRQLIARVVEVAVESENMRNPLWGVDFAEITTPVQVEEKERRTLPKSFTPLQQCAIGESIYSAVNSGKGLGLMLTHECGLRLKESAGTSIGDFMTQGQECDYSTIVVHSSTIGQGHERHNKLKTVNGNRIAILGPRATEILNRKVERLQNMIDKGEIILDPDSAIPVMEAIPIAHSQEDLLIPCSSPQLTQEFRHILREANYASEDYLAAQRIVESEEFQETERSVTPKDLGFAEVKDLTAYILRRALCTDAHIVGCTQEERQYIMGHRIEDTAVDRRDFRNNDKLAELATKLNKRPATNRDVLKPKEIAMDEPMYRNADFHSETIKMPVKKGKYVIRITSHEPLTPANATLTFPEGTKATCKYCQHQSNLSQRQTVNVLNDYYEAFRKAYAVLEERKNAETTATDEECN